MMSLLLTLAPRPVLLVTEKEMLYSPGWSALMPQASSTGTKRWLLLVARHLHDSQAQPHNQHVHAQSSSTG